jgi:hypothetical protein
MVSLSLCSMLEQLAIRHWLSLLFQIPVVLVVENHWNSGGEGVQRTARLKYWL